VPSLTAIPIDEWSLWLCHPGGPHVMNPTTWRILCHWAPSVPPRWTRDHYRAAVSQGAAE
jgi:hypothetical protein